MLESLILTPTADPLVFVAPDGRRLSPPPGWQCLPPGDAGLTRRVKAKGATWSVIEKRGRKAFSKGVWAPQEHIAAAQAELAAERTTASYTKRRQSDLARRERHQSAYVESFAQEVLAFLRFAPSYSQLAQALATRVTELATPVGSGTVARTERIPIEQRAEAAVIAWLRHQTTAYDQLAIPRVKGLRQKVRRELAEVGRVVLDRHRRTEQHPVAGCPLCMALANHIESSLPSD